MPGIGHNRNNSMMFVDRDLFSHRKQEKKKQSFGKVLIELADVFSIKSLPLAQAFWIYTLAHSFVRPSIHPFVRGHKFSADGKRTICTAPESTNKSVWLFVDRNAMYIQFIRHVLRLPFHPTGFSPLGYLNFMRSIWLCLYLYIHIYFALPNLYN